MDTSLQFLGHNAWLLTVDNYRILVDPFLTGNPKAAISTKDVGNIDYIFVSHGHGDHLGDTIELSKTTGATVVTVVEIAGWLRKHGVTELEGMNLGGGKEFPFGRVQLTPALHTSSLPDGSYGGEPCGFLFLLKDGKNLYFACDTGLFGDMCMLADYELDVACLPIGDYYTMGPKEALDAVGYLEPKIAIPCHYSTWEVIEQDAEQWKTIVEAETETKVVILEPGDYVQVEPSLFSDDSPLLAGDSDFDDSVRNE